VSSEQRRWVVLKFGGTSVASGARWQTIAELVEKRLAEGVRPLVVCSALAGISNLLEALAPLAAADRHHDALATIEARHLEIARELGLDGATLLEEDLAELRRLVLGASLLRGAGPPLVARIMAFGELLATRLGAAFLNARAIPTTWVDARSLLEARIASSAGARSYLAASCDWSPDHEVRELLAAQPTVAVLTQGFIARNAAGETVLLGRGGSDASAAYLAAKIGALRCEIWTDVPGMFTANPALIPSVRLLRSLDYDEAQEIASTGAKVLHPRSIPPVRDARIPLHVLSTLRPEATGTVISDRAPESGPQVKAISSRRGLTLISMESASMWQEVGFLAAIFTCFARHGFSIDAVSTSETNVTVSLDPGANVLAPEPLRLLLMDLSAHCEPRVIAPTASLSLVGRGIRAILHELGPVLEVFEELKVHLLTQAASDLNLTFFVDEEESERLVRQLHGLLFAQRGESAVFGPRWNETAGMSDADGEPPDWWRLRRAELLDLAARQSPVFVYDEESLRAAAQALLAVPAVDRLLYAVKANQHAGVLALFAALGLGFECVSLAEVEHVLALPGVSADRILFTPNFSTADEFARALALGVQVTIDNLHPLAEWPSLFAGHEVFLRLDPGRGRGHHAHVRTAGAQSKFGISPSDLDEADRLTRRCGARVTGLHAHTGSGIREAAAWSEVAAFLAAVAERFPDVRVLDVGGGLGVPERPGQSPLDLEAFGRGLLGLRELHPRQQLWIEPGRFLVAQAGVLLARATQLKRKGEVTYVGLETGMNSLIRPALYGAYHGIFNLSRLDQPSELVAHVVGPICESGDILGRARRLPSTRAGDVFLIATCGAYGRVMSSRYNMREPASEALLPSRARA
jgi:diaminopimelate decarboxylase/aspartate kinase